MKRDRFTFAALLVVVSTAVGWIWHGHDKDSYQDDKTIEGVQPRANGSVALPSSANPLPEGNSGITRQLEIHSAEGSEQAAVANTRSFTETVLAAPINVALNSKVQQQWRDRIYEDCHGHEIKNCKRLISEFSRILNVRKPLDDGWSDWMEGQILQSLMSRWRENGITRVGAKCDESGCVFVVAGKSVAELFGGPAEHLGFTQWLAEQPWNDELEKHSKLNGDDSTLAWELYGLRTEPYYVWYVVTRRE